MAEPSEKQYVKAIVEFVVEVSHPGQVMELARSLTQKVYHEADWADNYPTSWEEALSFLLCQGGLAELPVDGPVEVRTTTTEVHVLADNEETWLKR